MFAAAEQDPRLGVLVTLIFLWVLLMRFRQRGQRRNRFLTRRRIRRQRIQQKRDEFTAEEKETIRRLDNGLCVYCWAEGYEVRVHRKSKCRWVDGCDDCENIDHVQAACRGGRATVSNAVTSCRWHNRRKGARQVDEFMATERRWR